MPTILLQGRIAVPHADRLRKIVEDSWRVLTWHPDTDPVDAFAGLAAEADVIAGGAIPTPDWPPTPNLKLFQIPWTGFEFTSPERMPAGLPVCNVYEHETSIAEYILLGMLESRLAFRRMDADFRAKGWGSAGPGEGVFHGEVLGATVGIVGYGHIGEEVAKRAKAFGMKVVGIRRSQQPTPEWLDWLGTPDRLDELLSVSDFVVVTCDLNRDTRRLINEERLARMKQDAWIIAVSRGGVIDETALYNALSERRIGGAVIDVWWNYPKQDGEPVWPANHPFQELDNVLLSAHECGWTDAMLDRRWRFVVDNINRVMAGEPPENIVFHGTAG